MLLLGWKWGDFGFVVFIQTLNLSLLQVSALKGGWGPFLKLSSLVQQVTCPSIFK